MGCRHWVAFALGSNVMVSGVFLVLISLYFLTMATRAAFTMKKANLGAMQPLGPWPNARKV